MHCSGVITLLNMQYCFSFQGNTLLGFIDGSLDVELASDAHCDQDGETGARGGSSEIIDEIGDFARNQNGEAGTEASTRVVGSPMTYVESPASEVFHSDHMYFKVVQEEVVETENVASDKSVTSLSSSCSTEDADFAECNVDEDFLDCLYSAAAELEDLSSLTNLDLIDFEQLDNFPQIPGSDSVDTQHANQSVDCKQFEGGCSSPFMQLSDDMGGDVCSLPSPNSSPHEKVFVSDAIAAAFDSSDFVGDELFSVSDNDDGCGLSWEETFTLFPSLDL